MSEQTPDNRPVRYLDGDKVVYRASGFGQCDRLIVATSQEYYAAPHPEWFQAVLDEGTAMEPIIRHKWDSQTAVPTTFEQQPVELEIGEIAGKLIVVRGHIDGQAGVDNVVREFKKVRATQWDRFLRSGVEYLPTYPWQVSIYMHAMKNYGCEVVGGKMEVDEWGKPDITDLHQHWLEAPPLPFKAIVKRAIHLEGLISEGFDAKEVDCNKSVYPCPYFRIHDEKEDEDVYQLPVIGDAGGLARQYISQIDEAKREKARLRKEMQKWDKQDDVASEALKGCLQAMGPEAVKASILETEDYQVSRIRGHVPEATRRAYDKDYFAVKRVEQTSQEQNNE